VSNKPAHKENQYHSMTSVQSGVMQAHAIRIGAGEDLVPALKKAAQEAIEKSGSPSAFIVTAVGSLEFARLRMANACRVGENPQNSPNEIRDWNQRLEIVSLTGTFSVNGDMHVHMSVSDKDGNAIGGHLIDGTIFTTLELVIGTIQGVSFTREVDSKTGFDELVVRSV
jgi:predicted DNA-binding protein with PD1-like motif